VGHEAVADVLSAIALIDIEAGDLTTAPLLPGCLRSADAMHLATALRVNATAMVAYDGELCAAARTTGIEALSPHD
jgi:predicted nucleic acid-binding protein